MTKEQKLFLEAFKRTCGDLQAAQPYLMKAFHMTNGQAAMEIMSEFEIAYDSHDSDFSIFGIDDYGELLHGEKIDNKQVVARKTISMSTDFATGICYATGFCYLATACIAFLPISSKCYNVYREDFAVRHGAKLHVSKHGAFIERYAADEISELEECISKALSNQICCSYCKKWVDAAESKRWIPSGFSCSDPACIKAAFADAKAFMNMLD